MACGNDPSDKGTGGTGGCDTCEQLTTIAGLLASIDKKLPTGSGSGGGGGFGGEKPFSSNEENINNLVNYSVDNSSLYKNKRVHDDVRNKTEERVQELKRTLGNGNVRPVDESYFRSLGAREQNNLISRYNRLGTNAGAMSERMGGLAGNNAPLMTMLMNSASGLNPQQQGLMAEGKGGFKEFSSVVDKLEKGAINLNQAGVEFNKIGQKLNRQPQLGNRGGMLFASGLGGLAMTANVMQGYMENPMQGGLSAASRMTDTASSVGGMLGSLAGLTAFIPGVGLPLAAGLGLAGNAIGSFAGSAVGIDVNTGNILGQTNIGSDLAYTVGKDPTQTVQSNFAARMITQDNIGLTRANLQGLRDVSKDSNQLGTIGMDDASRMVAMQNIVLANRLSTGDNSLARLQSLASQGFSAGQYSDALQNFMYTPNVLGANGNAGALARQYMEQENNPLARRGMVSYENMGAVGQMTTDAISQSFFGTDIAGLGKMSQKDVLSMIDKQGGMGMFKSITESMGGAGQTLYDTASGVLAGKGKEVEEKDTKLIDALNNLTKVITENAKKIEKKKIDQYIEEDKNSASSLFFRQMKMM